MYHIKMTQIVDDADLHHADRREHGEHGKGGVVEDYCKGITKELALHFFHNTRPIKDLESYEIEVYETP